MCKEENVGRKIFSSLFSLRNKKTFVDVLGEYWKVNKEVIFFG